MRNEINLQDRMLSALRQQAQLEQELTSLQERVEELAPLDLKKGEEEELAQRFKQAAHSQDLYDASYAATEALYDGQGSVHEVLTDALERLKSVAKYDEQIRAYIHDLDSVRIVIDDTARDLEHYRDGIDFDPATLEAMDARLATLAKLRRKYQMDIDSLVDALAGWQEKIAHFASITMSWMGCVRPMPTTVQPMRPLLTNFMTVASSLAKLSASA